MAEQNDRPKCNAKNPNGIKYGWCSGRPVVHSEGDNHFCVFHAPRGIKKEKPKDSVYLDSDLFNVLVLAVIRQAKANDQECNFSGIVFEGDFELTEDLSTQDSPLPSMNFNYGKFQNVNFEGVVFSNAYFQGATFKGVNFKHARFNLATFSNAEFHESAWFEKAKFNDLSVFSQAVFSDMAHFDSVEFAYANFTKARFQKLAAFSGARFEEAFFARSIFLDNANFDFAVFKQKNNFEDARFLKKARFYNATFNNAIFNNAEFMNGDFKLAKFESADFHETLFKGSADFYNARFKSVDFTKTIFQGTVDFHFAEFLGNIIFNKNSFGDEFIDFRNIVIAKDIYISLQNLDLAKAAFLETDISKIDFISARPREEAGRYILHDEDMFYEDEHKGVFKSDEERNARLNQLEELYRAGKGQCAAKHNMFDYPLWHMSEKEMQRRRLKGTLTGYILNLYNLISGYGEEPKRAAWWLFGIIFAASIVIGSFGIVGDKDTDKPVSIVKRFEVGDNFGLTLNHKNFWDTSLYTLETLTYMKTPDYKPANNWTRAARIFFRLATTLQFTLFAFALRNRFRR